MASNIREIRETFEKVDKALFAYDVNPDKILSIVLSPWVTYEVARVHIGYNYEPPEWAQDKVKAKVNWSSAFDCHVITYTLTTEDNIVFVWHVPVELQPVESRYDA